MPIDLPFAPPLEPMLAKAADALPDGDGWLYEPKWDGFRALVFRDGDDVYENGKYSSGAAAHYAIGLHVDLAGNDRHNQGSTTAKNQYQGHARDGSIGVFLDGGGDDRYFLRNMCGGSANLCSVALFWDRSGDDAYEYSGDDSVGSIPPLGTATADPIQRGPRDDLATIGVFLDTGAYQDAGASNFNALPRPGTALVRGADAEMIRRHETLDDVFARDRVPARLRGDRDRQRDAATAGRQPAAAPLPPARRRRRHQPYGLQQRRT